MIVKFIYILVTYYNYVRIYISVYVLSDAEFVIAYWQVYTKLLYCSFCLESRSVVIP